ncbi:MAG: hypothetical protein ACI854_002165 [Arenicella sp.]|jgi:hypothetical protein
MFKNAFLSYVSFLAGYSDSLSASKYKAYNSDRYIKTVADCEKHRAEMIRLTLN